MQQQRRSECSQRKEFSKQQAMPAKTTKASQPRAEEAGGGSNGEWVFLPAAMFSAGIWRGRMNTNARAKERSSPVHPAAVVLFFCVKKSRHHHLRGREREENSRW